jgi:hypothetical protein
MNKNTPLEAVKSELVSLSQTAQSNIKGGLLLYCEEKRSSFFGIPYTSRQWKMANDGSLLLSIRM